jgi:hypothetical protein
VVSSKPPQIDGDGLVGRSGISGSKQTYILLNRQPPAEADFQRFFGVSSPAVHDMILGLERRGLISRVPRQPRSIRLMVSATDLPHRQSIDTSVARY